jgi:hypothetical protein
VRFLLCFVLCIGGAAVRDRAQKINLLPLLLHCVKQAKRSSYPKFIFAFLRLWAVPVSHCSAC